MESTKFVIVGAERTGSNLLVGLLNSHPQVLAGGELFNLRGMKRGNMAWPVARIREDERFLTMRSEDPVRFLEEIWGAASDAGVRAAGFKLLYMQGRRNPAVLDRLVADKSVKVIHIQRRNALHRYVSLERARRTDVWAKSADSKTNPVAPKLSLDLWAMLRDFGQTAELAAACDRVFEHHERFDVAYEDLAADPQGIGDAVLRFLGAEGGVELEVRFKKTGPRSIRQSVSNYDELASTLRTWAAFFDEAE